MERPNYCTKEHLEYLDNLRSGTSNLLSNIKHLLHAFPALTKDQAAQITLYWMLEMRKEA